MHLPKIEEIIASSYRSKDNKCTVQEKINWKLSQSLTRWKGQNQPHPQSTIEVLGLSIDWEEREKKEEITNETTW